MSAEIEISSTSNEQEFPYRALSTTAIASVIFAVVSLLGFFVWAFLGLAFVGMFLGFAGYSKIKRFPQEFAGHSLAFTGIVLNLLVILGGISLHSYVYLTEVPEGYTRVHFWELQQASNSPVDQPSSKAIEINGNDIFLKGYIHPSSGSGLLKRFILVPDLGTCCFGGQPKSSDMIEVRLLNGQTTKAGLTKKKLAGTFTLNRGPQKVTDFDNTVFYQMKVDQIR
ncbi:MAG: DUF3299 domain-containing protein [Rubripirellula sp.]|nr:hypothetical protein [Rhodopirellula sp.]MCH1438033.1 DUF3299 domain-containing protein [Rubripirellula sp.]OUX05885.1 MAG: hypothetical protein CBE00_08610 [Planctomycetaceae bacterium TMED240]